jgi:hypothetical protein
MRKSSYSFSTDDSALKKKKKWGREMRSEKIGRLPRWSSE